MGFPNKMDIIILFGEIILSLRNWWYGIKPRVGVVVVVVAAIKYP